MVNIKVAVRIRPVSSWESKNSGSSVIVCAEQNRISLTNLKVPLNKAGDSRERTRKYNFHYCFDSSDPQSKNYADQAKIYEILGKSLLNDLFAGYNSCFLAYGQSASGKTYTMMGTEEEPGLTPRLCQDIFARMDEEKNKGNIFDISISYLEIYNEQVRDLLETSSGRYRNLRVREHPRLGPYVQGLTHRVACTLEKLMSYVQEGTRARKKISTTQNANSSRSHALLTIFLSSDTDRPIGESIESEKTASISSRRDLDSVRRYSSKLHLVDLAGSETVRNSDGGVHRLKVEGANINRSLVALGNVISALTRKTSTSSNKGYIPYRDSSLTWLLKDALGGNATTIMLATISGASRNYNETAHTLRFAERAHSVVNKPVVNEDPVARTIRELKAEIAWLKSLLREKNIDMDTRSLSYYREQVESTNCDLAKGMTATMKNDGMANNTRRVVRSVDGDNGILPTIRRMNSNENVAIGKNNLINSTNKKFGSYERLDRKISALRTGYSYNRAKISELEYEERELVGEINEAVFVDIPTLVAVLIKPDNTCDENNSSAQIEEICSEEMQEDPIEHDFITESHPRASELASDEYKHEGSHFDSVASSTVDIIRPCNETNDRCDTCVDSIVRKERTTSQKKGSVNNVRASVSHPSTNLYTLSRRFGSAEILEKKRERLGTLERSHTSLEKQAAVLEETDERYNKDSKNGSYPNLWKDSNKGQDSNGRSHLQREGSNESDKAAKDNSWMSSTSRTRNNAARKPSLESLKRKTSKDSSSSSSKDEQILISSLQASERTTLRRKDSMDHNASTRATHTPVQRVKRAEIVAAVTERLYSSRKQVEETGATGVTGSMSTSTALASSSMSTASTSGVRSPPEGTDVRSATMTTSAFTPKTKLQEISRKMLAKRRRVNADTQTEQMQTIRMKDSSSSTDESKILFQDVGILTDEHDGYETKMDRRLPILRVKEIATLTDKLRSNVTEFKDAECLVNDLNFYEYGVHFLHENHERSSENSRYYTANKMSNTDSLKLCLANNSNNKVDRFDKSTNTNAIHSVERNPNVHVYARPVVEKTKEGLENSSSTIEKPEKNVISMSLPDAINITIETANVVESKVMLMDDTTEEIKISSNKRDMLRLRNNESQTEKQNIERIDKGDNPYAGGFATKASQVNQMDNKSFRIENIFKDSRNLSRICTEEVLQIPPEKRTLKASVTFTNSLGTCFVPETRECATGMDKGQLSGREWSGESSQIDYGRILKRDTRSCIQREQTSSRDKNIKETFRCSTDIWKNWIISFPPTSWQCSRNFLSPINVEPWTFAWNSTLTPSDNECTTIVSSANLRRSPTETTHNSSDLFFSNDFYNKDQASDSLKSPSLINRINTKGLVEQDYNFSDDSLDYNEENLLSNSTNNNRIEITEEEEKEAFENVCPPDVVAHTKKESSMLIENSYDNGIDSSSAYSFKDNRMEFPKRGPNKPEVKTTMFVNDSKSSILRQRPMVNVNQQEARTEHHLLNYENDPMKKKVTFLDNETLIKFDRGSQSETNSLLNRNLNIPKIVIEKKISDDKETTDDNDSRIVHADNGDDTEDQNQKVKKESSFKNDCSSYDGIEIYRNFIKNCGSLKLKKKLLEEYLREATAFMRNINSLNECVNSNANVYKEHLRDERRKRGNHRRSCSLRNYAKLEDNLIVSDVNDDNLMNESLTENVCTESFEKCLESLTRLENCIQKANDHDRYLSEEYNIVLESAGAKSGLANSSTDSDINSKTSSNLIKENGIVRLQKLFIRTEAADRPSKRTPFKNSSMIRTKSKNEGISDSFGVNKFFDTNNKIVCDHCDLEKRDLYKLTNAIENYEQRMYHDTDKLYHSHDDNRNTNNLLDDSVERINESAQLSNSTLIKPTKSFRHLEKLIGNNGSSRQTTANAFMRYKKGEISNFINSRTFHNLATSNTTSYLWKYRPESPRAKFLKLLRERRRIVEISRDINS